MKPTRHPSIRVCETGITEHNDALIDLHRCQDFNELTRHCRRIAFECLGARVSLSHFPHHPVTIAHAGNARDQSQQNWCIDSAKALRIRAWLDPPVAHSGSGGVCWRSVPQGKENPRAPGSTQPEETALLFGRAAEFSGILILRKARWAQEGRGKDIGHLRALHQHLAAALQRIQDKTKDDALRSALAALLQRTGHPFLVLDWEARVLFATSAARAIQSVWPKKSRAETGNDQPASDILAFIESRKKRWHANPSRYALLHRRIWIHECPSRKHWKAKLSLLPCRVHHPHAMRFLVEFAVSGDNSAIENRRSADRKPKPSHPLLNPAEIALLSTFSGETNRELARRVGKSIHTVKRQLSSIYRKTGVTNRYELLAYLNRIGKNPPQQHKR